MQVFYRRFQMNTFKMVKEVVVAGNFANTEKALLEIFGVYNFLYAVDPRDVLHLAENRDDVFAERRIRKAFLTDDTSMTFSLCPLQPFQRLGQVNQGVLFGTPENNVQIGVYYSETGWNRLSGDYIIHIIVNNPSAWEWVAEELRPINCTFMYKRVWAVKVQHLSYGINTVVEGNSTGWSRSPSVPDTDDDDLTGHHAPPLGSGEGFPFVKPPQDKVLSEDEARRMVSDALRYFEYDDEDDDK
jgi:hypothetical protein